MFDRIGESGWMWIATTVAVVLGLMVVFVTLTHRTNAYVQGGYCEHKLAGMGESIYWSKPPKCGVEKP